MSHPTDSRCVGCPLERVGKGFARIDGEGRRGVLILAEALGEDEAWAGKPMVGRAGKLLDRMISRLTDPSSPSDRFVRSDFWIANVINCQPPNDFLTGADYEEEAIRRCSPYLEETLGRLRPRAILATGNQALRWLTGHWGIDNLRGYIHETQWGPVIGTYHPSYIARGKFPLTRVFQMDLLKAIHTAQGKEWKVPKNYIYGRNIGQIDLFARRYEEAGFPPLAFDIETPYARIDKDEFIEPSLEDDASYTILRISFSFQDGEAITVPWTPEFTIEIRRILGSPGDKIVWNQNFDVPRLQANGCPIGGTIYDGMEAFHFLEPSLPMGLKFAATFYCPDLPPWKLLVKEDPEWYSCADSDAARRVFLATRKGLERQVRWDTYVRHYVEFGKVLREMARKGVLVDRERREKERGKLEARYDGVLSGIQPLIPTELRPKKVYKFSEERLRKSGKWVEGEMVLVTTLEKEKHIHDYQYGDMTDDSRIVCECGRSKKRPKPKKERKKKSEKHPTQTQDDLKSV